MGVGVCVVVYERDYFAFRESYAAVALLGRANLARRDNSHAIAGYRVRNALFRRKLSVRQDDDLEVAVRLGRYSGKALLKHPAGGRTRYHDRHERVAVQFRRDFRLSVVLEHPEPVENGERIESHRAHRCRAQRAEFVAEAYHHRRLGYLRAALAGDCKKLEIERIRLDEHAAERLAENLSAKELHAGLRVGYRQSYKQPHEREVDPAHGTAVPRVLHDGMAVPLRTDHDIGLLVEHLVEKPRRLLGVDVEIAVKQHHVFARRRVESRSQRGALAAVSPADHGLHRDVPVFRRGGPAERLGCSVGRAVVDRHQLGPHLAGFEQSRGAGNVGLDRRCQIVDRHDDREAAGPDRLPDESPFLVQFRHLTCAAPPGPPRDARSARGTASS